MSNVRWYVVIRDGQIDTPSQDREYVERMAAVCGGDCVEVEITPKQGDGEC